MSDVLIKPAFISTYPDSGDATKFGPNAWNAARLLSGGATGQSVVADTTSATGAAWAERSRVLTVNTTQTGTPATLVETDLWTYSLPANTLNADGRAVRIMAWGALGADANAKTVRLYFGATTLNVYTAGTGNALVWRFDATVIRTGASAQIGVATMIVGSAWLSTINPAPAADTTGAIVIRVTGLNGVAVLNDIVARGAIVELLN